VSFRLKIVVSLVYTFLLVANSARGQTLIEAVETTLRTNPDIQSSRHNVEAARELRKQARSGYFPTLDLVIATGEEVSDNTTTRAAGLDELRLDRVERSLRLTQLLYDGFGTRNLVRQQAHLVDACEPFRSIWKSCGGMQSYS
jgi:adhesin transport system outer membrane protein